MAATTPGDKIVKPLGQYPYEAVVATDGVGGHTAVMMLADAEFYAHAREDIVDKVATIFSDSLDAALEDRAHATRSHTVATGMATGEHIVANAGAADPDTGAADRDAATANHDSARAADRVRQAIPRR